MLHLHERLLLEHGRAAQLPPELDFAALFHGVDERVPVDAVLFGAGCADPLYRRWVSSFDPGPAPDPAAWQGRVRQVALSHARELLDSAPPAAWSGLPAGEDRSQPLNAARAANWFYINLRDQLPDAEGTAEGGAA